MVSCNITLPVQVEVSTAMGGIENGSQFDQLLRMSPEINHCLFLFRMGTGDGYHAI